MAFELPELPYDYDALAPYMSRETLEFHHDKHHKAYVDNGNKLAAEAGLSDLSLEEVVKKSFGTNAGLFNNAAQHYNHVHFWKWLKKDGGGNKLPGKLEQAFASDLGGYDKFKADFIAMRHHAVRLRLGVGFRQERQARNLQDSERRKPAGSRCRADPRRRRLGTLLLHRLPQPASEVPRSLR